MLLGLTQDVLNKKLGNFSRQKISNGVYSPILTDNSRRSAFLHAVFASAAVEMKATEILVR